VSDDNSPNAGRLDLILTLIMALAAVGTAWAGFESTKWSGQQADSYARAGAFRTESTLQATEAGQERIVDLIAFTQWLSALNEELVADPDADPTGVYMPKPGTISGFLYQRFRPEFRPAVDAWITTKPLTDPKAPATPFVMPQYVIAAEGESERLAEQADDASAEARDANQLSDNYVLTAVFFALVLFFAAFADRARRRLSRMLLLVMAAGALILAVGALMTFPVLV
jgi:hypothetical protein